MDTRKIKIERLKKRLPEIVEHNEREKEKLRKFDVIADTEICYFVTDGGQIIYNPYQDETGRKEVNPFEYYNVNYLLTMLDQYDDVMENKTIEYEMEGTLKIKLKTTLEDNKKPNESTMLAMLEEDLQDFLREAPWQIEESDIEDFKVEIRKK